MPAVGLNIGKAIAYLELDTSKFTKGFTDAKSELKGFTDSTRTTGERVTSLGNTFKSVGSSLTNTITTPLAAVGAGAVKVGMDFEQGMAQVKAISGATGKDFDSLREKALEMGRKTKFSASESAEAMNYMAMAGWKTQDMLAGIEPIMNLAAASGADLATTSDIVTDALTGFGLEAQDTERFVDVLSATMANSNTNVEMLGESFKYVAPVAGSLGYTVEDTALALGLMANSGIKASQAGTSLRAIMTRLASGTGKAGESMEQLGIEMFDAEGNARPFRDVLEDLREAFQGTSIMSDETREKIAGYAQQLENGEISQEQYNQLMFESLGASEDFKAQLAELDAQLASGQITQEEYDQGVQNLITSTDGLSDAQAVLHAYQLAGMTGMSGFLALVNAGEEDYNKLAGAIDNSNGATQEMVDIMMNTLKGAFDIFKSSLESAGIEISDVLIPHVRSFAEWLTKLVTWFADLDSGTQNLIIKFGLFLAALGPIASIIGSITTIGGSLLKVFGGLKTAVDVVSGASGGGGFAGLWKIMAAHPILSLVAVLGTLILTNEKVRDVLKKVWEIIKEVVVNSIKDAIDWIGKFGKKIKDFFTGADKDTNEHKKKQKQHNKEIKEDADKSSKEAGEKRKKNTKDANRDIDKETEDHKKKQKKHNKDIKDDADKSTKESGEKRVKNTKDANSKIETATNTFKTSQVSKFVSMGNDIVKSVSDTNDKRVSSDTKAWGTIDSNTRTGAKNLVWQFVSMGRDITKSTKETGEKNASNIKSGNDNALKSTNNFATQSTRVMGGWAKNVVAYGQSAGVGISGGIERARVSVGNSLVGLINNSYGLLKNFASGMGTLGRNAINSFVSGINSGMQMARNAISGLASMGQSIANTVGNIINGRHALGLDYVPFDGYVAELHKGERVLTKQENEAYTKGINMGNNVNRENSAGGDTFVFYNTKPDPYTYSRQMKKAKRELLYNT